jgi:hypothetical protein
MQIINMEGNECHKCHRGRFAGMGSGLIYVECSNCRHIEPKFTDGWTNEEIDLLVDPRDEHGNLFESYNGGKSELVLAMLIISITALIIAWIVELF